MLCVLCVSVMSVIVWNNKKINLKKVWYFFYFLFLWIWDDPIGKDTLVSLLRYGDRTTPKTFWLGVYDYLIPEVKYSLLFGMIHCMLFSLFFVVPPSLCMIMLL